MKNQSFGRILLAEGGRYKEHTPIMEMAEHCMDSFTSSLTEYCFGGILQSKYSNLNKS